MRWLIGFILTSILMGLHGASTAKAAKIPDRPPEPEPRPRPRPTPKKKKPRPPTQRRPFKMEFFVRISGLEKLSVDEDDIKETALKNAHIGPGHGPVQVFVKDAPGGYRVRMQWPDSSGTIGVKDAKVLIEGIDSRMFGRVSQVKVTRR